MSTKRYLSLLLPVLVLSACDLSEGPLRNGSSVLSARVAASSVTPVDQVNATLTVSGTPSNTSHAYVKSQNISLGTVPFGATYSVAMEGKISTPNGYASRWWAFSGNSTASNPVETVTLQFVDGPAVPQASYDSLKVAGHLLLPASTKYSLDGSDPRTSGTALTASGTIALTSTGTVLAATYSQAIATTGQPTLWSDVASWVITATGTTQTANAPTFTPAAGAYTSTLNVTMKTTTAGASIYYTTDGSTPTTNSAIYSSAISVSASQTIKAIATMTGMTNSSVSSAAYTITTPAAVASPTFTPGTGTYTSAQSISLNTTTAGASIYYTTDGSTPTTNSAIYSSAISVSASQTIKAIATMTGMTNSSVSSATYTINVSSANSFTDSRDNQVYQIVKIGTQTWMAQNLNYVTSGSRAYQSSPDSAAKYGQLYDWNTAMAACPTGWHLPSDAEWTQLETSVNGSATAGTALKSTSGWSGGGNGKDTYGFKGLPAGYYSSGSTGSGQYAVWWTSSESSAGYTAYTRMLYYTAVGSSSTYYFPGNESGTYNSVRCVK